MSPPFQDKSLLLNGIILREKKYLDCGFLHEGKNNNTNSGIFFVKDSNHQRSGKLWMLFVEKLLHKNRKNIQICNVIYCIHIEGTEGLKAYMHFKNVLKNCNECY